MTKILLCAIKNNKIAGELVEQAERKSTDFDPKPDLGNANVGSK